MFENSAICTNIPVPAPCTERENVREGESVCVGTSVGVRETETPREREGGKQDEMI